MVNARQTSADCTPIPLAKLPEMIDKPIHLSWAWRGTVWILRKIHWGRDYATITVETPKTHKIRTAKAGDACYVRRYDPNKQEDGYV